MGINYLTVNMFHPGLNDLYTQCNDFNDLDKNTYEKYYTYNLNGNFEFVKTYEDK